MRLFPRGRRAWLRVLLIWGGLTAALIGGGRLMLRMPGRSYRGPLPQLTPEEGEVRDRLAAHVRMLAQTIGPRYVRRVHALEAAATYVGKALGQGGYTVSVQEYGVEGTQVRNLEAELPGLTLPEEILVVGAHYDTVAETPGADDNATGVAAMLEMARLLAGRRLDRTVRFVAFPNEEPPFFMTREMGSRVYAARCRERGERIVGAVICESVGYYSDQEGSQGYPFPLGLLYPGTGDFVGFVGNLSSRGLVRRTIGSFRRHTQFPSEGAALPCWIPGVWWSDHWSFWQEGYPALMVTDTAPFRNPHYHMATDTPDTLDFDRMARVTAGLARVVVELASDGQSP